MKEFFKGVCEHIGKLDASQLREQYGLVTDETANSKRFASASSTTAGPDRRD